MQLGCVHDQVVLDHFLLDTIVVDGEFGAVSLRCGGGGGVVWDGG